MIDSSVDQCELLQHSSTDQQSRGEAAEETTEET